MSFEVDTRNFDEVFPPVPCQINPVGNRLVVQLRRSKTKTNSGIFLVDETKDTEKYNEVICIVRKLGPLAYKDVQTMEAWPEGAWCKEGDLVRTIKWGGDRWSVPYEDSCVNFIILQDREIIGVIESFEAAQVMQPFVAA